MSYRKLGKLVKSVDIKNTDGKITKVIGVSITKTFIPSVANLHGVDLTKYNLIKKNQFACKLMSVGRDLQLPIDLYKEDDYALISSAYYVFEVQDENLILPDYLNMWFRRSESDRWVGYISGGDVRGGISWDMFMEMDVKVPSIEKQYEIVSQYEAVTNKIKANEAICEKLEATAQALYKQWFVDFEFLITKESHPEFFYHSELVEESTTKSYKSSGGKMVFNEELEKEIPEGWQVKSLGEVSNISAGGDKPKIFSENSNQFCKIPIYSNSTDNYGLFGFTDKPKINSPSITVSARGAIIGYTLLRKYPFVPIVRLITITPYDDYIIYYLFKVIETFKYDDNGSAQGQLTVPDISNVKLLLPPNYLIKEYYRIYNEIENLREYFNNQNQKLTQLQSLLLSRLATLEG